MFQDQDHLFQHIEGLHIISQESPILPLIGQEVEDGTKIIVTIVEPTMKYIIEVSIIAAEDPTTDMEEGATIPQVLAIQINFTAIEDPIIDIEEVATIRQTLAIQALTVKGSIIKVLEDLLTVELQMKPHLNLKKIVLPITKFAPNKKQSVLQQLLQ